ncbi:MAG: DUF1573 domain-containing protein [Saprospiraceae bacterium]|nr:DUF1573 domain-containing protein [Saprospiraceae bacterium]
MVSKITLFILLTWGFVVNAQSQTPTTKEGVKVDTTLVPVMSFDKKKVNLGTIKAGKTPEMIFTFKNTGKKDLDILIVTACECTELDWTRTTVKVGETGFIKALFHSDEIDEEDLKKPLKKSIDIILKQTDPILDYPIVEILDFEVIVNE